LGVALSANKTAPIVEGDKHIALVKNLYIEKAFKKGSIEIPLVRKQVLFANDFVPSILGPEYQDFKYGTSHVRPHGLSPIYSSPLIDWYLQEYINAPFGTDELIYINPLLFTPHLKGIQNPNDNILGTDWSLVNAYAVLNPLGYNYVVKLVCEYFDFTDKINRVATAVFPIAYHGYDYPVKEIYSNSSNFSTYFSNLIEQLNVSSSTIKEGDKITITLYFPNRSSLSGAFEIIVHIAVFRADSPELVALFSAKDTDYSLLGSVAYTKTANVKNESIQSFQAYYSATEYYHSIERIDFDVDGLPAGDYVVFAHILDPALIKPHSYYFCGLKQTFRVVDQALQVSVVSDPCQKMLPYPIGEPFHFVAVASEPVAVVLKDCPSDTETPITPTHGDPDYGYQYFQMMPSSLFNIEVKDSANNVLPISPGCHIATDTMPDNWLHFTIEFRGRSVNIGFDMQENMSLMSLVMQGEIASVKDATEEDLFITQRWENTRIHSQTTFSLSLKGFIETTYQMYALELARYSHKATVTFYHSTSPHGMKQFTGRIKSIDIQTNRIVNIEMEDVKIRKVIF
jgi:hypothetical protein